MKSKWPLILVLFAVAVCLVVILNPSWRQKISRPGDTIGSLLHRSDNTVATTARPSAEPAAPVTAPPAAAAPLGAASPAGAPPPAASRGSSGSVPAGSGDQGSQTLSSSRPPSDQSPTSAAAPPASRESQRPAAEVSSAPPPAPPPEPLPRGKTVVTRLVAPLNSETIHDGDPIVVSAVLPPDFTGDHLHGHILIQRTAGAEGLLLDFNILDRKGSRIAVETKILKVQNAKHDLTVTPQGLIAGAPDAPLRVSVPAGAYLVVSVRRR